MEKCSIIVPPGVRYLLDWDEFRIPDHPCVINKRLTGCGFTEFCLRPNKKMPYVILVSPRRTLLESKEKNHNTPAGKSIEEVSRLMKTRGHVHYAKNTSEVPCSIDIDLEEERQKAEEVKAGLRAPNPKDYEEAQESPKAVMNLRKGVADYWAYCKAMGEECKIMVTYDSFRHVKEVLGQEISGFYVIVDEFQSIFMDSTFKSETEMEFLSTFTGLDKLCFVSATPMLDKYLDRMPEFQNLPYYELDWETADPGRTKHPRIISIRTDNVSYQAKSWIDKYKNGKFERKSYVENGVVKEVYSKELVVYVNSVKNICSLIKTCKLSPDECNVLCADTPNNLKKVRAAFRCVDKSYKIDSLGSIPDYGEPRKMFTLCTRTVYLGADFYSDNAKSIVLSDSNISCLSVDISLDLPQILGRQRLESNPWKDEATLYYKTSYKDISREEFDAIIRGKVEITNKFVETYQNNPFEAFANVLALSAKMMKYKDDYVSINRHAGSMSQAVFNRLVMMSEERAYEVQQIDFRDQFSVFTAIEETSGITNHTSGVEIDKFIETFTKERKFEQKFSMLCDYIEQNPDEEDAVLFKVPQDFVNYYTIIGPDGCRAVSFRKHLLEERYQRIKKESECIITLDEALQAKFQEGQSYSKVDIKRMLQEVYDELGIPKKAKATDLGDYYEIQNSQVSNKETGKRDSYFRIIKKKQ